ncbi:MULTISPECIES: SAV_2336 N-terminal domain-related protein [Streptomyces]|uniref:Phosphoglycolate phosphatase n=1 Tax=Streptomyces chartreusis NRRL 3882 TaxID=1079985 RepID=A0A2N9BFD2_STRCX|nr:MULTISPECIES: SAV_2336 N-terminal domain-related protein [Streptomyces]MYS95447.1 serine/threonine protein kinase [Streptomyces sp. SID5464]SOR82051.1 phosphoglycolate phosphatase [Streptomyces chartreusis NRRL 3882]
MVSDHGPGPSPVARLAAALSAAGASPTPRELAELLWMAALLDRERQEEEPSREPGEDRAPSSTAPAHEAGNPEASTPGKADTPTPVPPQPEPVRHTPDRVPLTLPAPRSPQHRHDAPGGGGSPLLAPAPPMLPHPLALQRALRPLKRKVASAHVRVLDERATADRIARLGAHPDVWFPVLRPAPDRWLRLNLVHDTGPTMPVWRPLVSELHTALAQSGIFRDVTLHPAAPDGRARHVPVLDDGRTVTLVVSDCMGPQWRPGEAGDRWYRTLRHWARHMPLAVVQPLPEHLWPTTALPAEPGLLTSPSTAAPSARLAFTPYEAAPPPDHALPVPVLEPGAPWLAHWAALVAGPGGARTPGAAAWLPPSPAPPAEPTPDIASSSPEDLVLRFRATASPEAFRLAGHLALAVPSVPVMRLVQRTVDRDPRPQHLAEVILSGMLTSVPGPPGSYEFRPGVRELLLRSLPRTARGRTREFLEQVGGLIDERAGRAAGEFRAETTGERDGSGMAFATVSEETVRRLGHRARPTILFEADDLTGHPEARITLEYAVHEMLSRGALTASQFDVRVRGNGYVVHADPGTYVLPVLVAVLRGLPEVLTGLVDPPRLTVTFWDRPTPPPEAPPVPADILVVVSPDVYEQFAGSSAAQGPQRFQPLYRGGATDTPPVAWYCPLSPATAAPGPEARDLVRGPFITHDLRRLGIPAPGRTAVVHTQPDGPLTLLDPAQPHGDGPPRLVTYYEVDLTTHQSHHWVSLPSSGKGAFAAAVELSWRVDDPVAFVRAGVTRVSEPLLGHLLDEAARITRRHPLRRAGAAQRAVNAGLRRWPVPGLSVAASVELAPEGAAPPGLPQAPARSAPDLSGLLDEAETVLLGFDGPMARLFSAATAREAALDLLTLVTEHRDPQDALTGRPLAADAARETFVHPLDVLRAFARDRLGPLLRDRLDAIELRAVPDAPTTHNSVPLVRALHDSGRRVSVVTDVSAPAVHRYLDPYGLPLAGIHARGEDLALLTPHPDCLLRAMHSSGGAAATGVLIGSTVAELTAAQQAGVRFVGLARNTTAARQLDEAGCETTVSSLAPLLEAARSL